MRRRHALAGRRAPLAITVLFLVSRVAFLSAGVRFDDVSISGRPHSSDWQMLDFAQLQHNLLQSIWYLHSQPPLFNVATGLVLKLPASLHTPVLVVGSLVMGLGIALAAFYLCLELGVPRWVSFAVTVLVILDPAMVVYGNWFFYTYPTALLLVVGALCLARYLRTEHVGWGLGFFAALAGTVLLNSTFQWPWLLLAAVPVVFVLRTHWRTVLTVAAVPILCVVVWSAKDAVIFHTVTTSSWTGMNLARISTLQASPSRLAELIRNGTLSRSAAITPFTAPPSAYGHKLSSHPRTGVAVLDEVTKSDGTINFNNVNFIAIANGYLHNDVAFVETEPGTYLRSVAKAALVFSLPSDQYVFVSTNENHLGDYARAYDLLVDWQLLGTDPATVSPDSTAGYPPAIWHVSIAAVLELLATMVGAPIMAWKRRANVPFSLTLAFIAMTTIYVFVLTNLVELGENNRFRFDLGPLPLIATAAIVTAFVVRPSSDSTAPPLPGDREEFVSAVPGD